VILDEILAHKRRELKRLRETPLVELKRQAEQAPDPPSFYDALAGPGVAVIAEIKRRSPSRGVLREALDPEALARAFSRGGARAISCLTDERYFGGSLELLRRVAQASRLPVLRKDFIIDERQVLEARAWGAAAVLLIVAALSAEELRELLRLAREWGVDALVEAHTADEARLARDLGARIVGINNRDLRTFSVSLETTERVLAEVDLGGCLVVSESGIHDAADVDKLGRLGIDAVLVGEALMRAEDPEAKLRELCLAGRGHGANEG